MLYIYVFNTDSASQLPLQIHTSVLCYKHNLFSPMRGWHSPRQAGMITTRGRNVYSPWWAYLKRKHQVIQSVAGIFMQGREKALSYTVRGGHI